MGELHNLQILIAQQPQFARLDAAHRNGYTNGAQIINVIGAAERELKKTKVKQLQEGEKVEKENSKRKRKTTLEQKIDLFT